MGQQMSWRSKDEKKRYQGKQQMSATDAIEDKEEVMEYRR